MKVRPSESTACSQATNMQLRTIDQLADEIGLTPRTIRSYHARGLLPPPVRVGRKPMYGLGHLIRMRNVLRLQSRGLPLEAIRALLEPDLVLGQFLPPGHSFTAALRAEPNLLNSLIACGVLVRNPDGGLVIRNARAVLAAHAAGPAGASISQTLHVLADAVTATLPHARDALIGVDAAVRDRLPGRAAVPEALIDLTVEALRLALTHLSSLGADQTAEMVGEYTTSHG